MTTRFGLTVRYDGNSVFKVELSGAYQGLVSGLCGDFDGNPDNDLRLPTDPETDVGINVFGDFFQSGGLSTRLVEYFYRVCSLFTLTGTPELMKRTYKGLII